MKFNHITIIGTGLIGGSIGLAVKKRRLAKRVTGVTAHKSSLRRAVRMNAIDDGTLDAARSVSGADLVIIATPVDKVVPTVKKIAKHLKPGCIVTDAASTKAGIVAGAEAALKPGRGDGSAGRKLRPVFVGGHPMAGSEKRGVAEARQDLYEDSICLLTRTARTDPKALRKVASFWRLLGAKVTVISPALHDRLICEVSHLPHIAAAALCLAAGGDALRFASTGFEDTTRVASGDPRIWTPIVCANRKNILLSLDGYISILRDTRAAIKRSDCRRVTAFLGSARAKRGKMQRQAPKS